MALFYILLFTSILWTTQSTILVEQGAQFIFPCQSKQTESNLALAILSDNVYPPAKKCLVDCKFQSSIPCNDLRLKSSNFECEFNKYCYREGQCHFIFKSASIQLDGTRLACLDSETIINEANIKGLYAKLCRK